MSTPETSIEREQVRLTDTSYVVLGLVEACQPATPYDLKRFAEISVFHFWSVPHTQVYSECARLAQAGLLEERREQRGRRRRIYRLASPGERALDEWREQPRYESLELRDVGLIKLFFDADPKQLAEVQLAGHREQLGAYEKLAADYPDMPSGQRLALEAGIRCEAELVRFWSQLAGGTTGPA